MTDEIKLPPTPDQDVKSYADYGATKTVFRSVSRAKNFTARKTLTLQLTQRGTGKACHDRQATA
jgi:hypothetical protein